MRLSSADMVGLDIGVSSIKAVRVRQMWSGRRVITFFRRPLPSALPWADIDQKIRMVKEFMHANRLTGLPVMTSLSCTEIILRTIGLPFRNIKTAGQLVSNEVESLIPLPLEEVAVGYQFLPSLARIGRERQSAVSHALVAVAPTQTLAAHLQRMRDAGFEPKAVQPDALALFCLFRHMRERRPGFPSNAAIIDIGASKTMICVTLGGHPWLVRTICHGVNDLNRSKDEPIVDPDGETEYELRGLDKEPKEPGFGTLLRELRLTLHTYQSTAETAVRHVLFCGGGGGLPALTCALSQRLKLEPINVPFLHHSRGRSAYSVALGLALFGSRSKAPHRFRRTVTASGIDLKKALEHVSPKGPKPLGSLKTVGLGVSVVVLLGVSDLLTQASLKEQHLQRLSGELRSTFRQHFPNIDVITDELEQAKIALSAAQKIKELTGGEETVVLPRLAALVKQLPQGIKFKITGLTIEPRSLNLEGETDSFDSVELMKRELQTLPGVQDIVIRDLSVGSLPGQVLFRLTIATL